MYARDDAWCELSAADGRGFVQVCRVLFSVLAGVFAVYVCVCVCVLVRRLVFMRRLPLVGRRARGARHSLCVCVCVLCGDNGLDKKRFFSSR